MRTLLIIIWLVFAAELQAAANETIDVGDPLAKVLRLLGKPAGEIHSSSYSMLSYPRGKVELRDNLVTKVDLISEKQLLDRQKARDNKIKAQRAQASLLREQRIKKHNEGLKQRNITLADTNFLASPIEHQLSYWDNFRKLYPTVKIDNTYRSLLVQYQQDQAQNQQLHQEQNMVQQNGSIGFNNISMPVIDDVYTPDIYYPAPPQPIIWLTPQNCREPRNNHNHHQNQNPVTIRQLQDMQQKSERRQRNSYGTVHPDSPFGNNTIRAIRIHKNQTMRAFRHH